MKKYYDLHCHVFNKSVITDRFVNILAPILEVIDDADDLSVSWNDKLEEKLEKIKAGMDKVERFLDAFMKGSSQEVFEVIDKVYSNQFNLTPLMIDLKYADDNDGNMVQDLVYQEWREMFLDIVEEILTRLKPVLDQDKELQKQLTQLLKGKHETSFWGRLFTDKDEMFSNRNFQNQITELKKIAENERVLPFFGIDPRRQRVDKQNLVGLIKTNILDQNAKFRGVKLYAPMGYSPTDPVLFGDDANKECVYQICQENKIPITVHCSNGGFACTSRLLRVHGHIYRDGRVQYVSNDKIKFKYSFFSYNAKKAIAERAETLNHPKVWEKVLEKYPNLVINFAHFGGDGQMMDYALYHLPDSLSTTEFKDLLEPLDDDAIATIKENYYKVDNKYTLKAKITESEKCQLWNKLYLGGAIDNWTKAIYDIISNKKYPNAYTDLSCFSGHNKSHAGEGGTSMQEDLALFKQKLFDKWKADGYTYRKILYGSDFFFSLMFVDSIDDYFASFKTVFGEDFETIASVNAERFLNVNVQPSVNSEKLLSVNA